MRPNMQVVTGIASGVPLFLVAAGSTAIVLLDAADNEYQLALTARDLQDATGKLLDVSSSASLFGEPSPTIAALGQSQTR